MCMNATALIIMILSYLKIDMKVLDTNIENVKSNDYREILRNDKNTNGILVIILSESVVSKNQRARKIKQSNIKVQIHIITDRKDYRQINNFGDIIV